MLDVLAEIRRWYATGEPFALATVVDTYKSSPRQPGATMAVSSSGEAVGSVSGGCVEGAVYELGQTAIETGQAVFQRYGVSDDDAFTVGLTCGGIIDMFVERISRESYPEFEEVVASIDAKEPVAVATIVGGPGQLGARMIVWRDRHSGSLGSEMLDAHVLEDARGQLAHGRTGTIRYGEDGVRMGVDLPVFIQSYAPAAQMLVFGAIDFAGAVASVGRFLGYHVTVCDARPIFATKKRFPGAHEVVVEWPHRFLQKLVDAGQVDERTVICVLTHDPKFDVPVLQVALKTRAGYIGAMGSRRTHEDRLARLREVGVTEAEIARMFSPIGLDLRARTPEETAISIAAEIIVHRWGGTGSQLRETEGAIHKEFELPDLPV